MKYLLVKDGVEEREGDGGGGKEGKVRAFASLMPTWEDERRVLYCYEVHVQEGLQGLVSFLSSVFLGAYVFPPQFNSAIWSTALSIGSIVFHGAAIAVLN